MYYKVIKDGKIIDVLDEIIYLKYNEKHKRFLHSNKNYAQAILSSDSKQVWHINSLLNIPAAGYETVELEEINISEYNKLKFELACDVDSLLDAYTLLLMERGIL